MIQLRLQLPVNQFKYWSHKINLITQWLNFKSNLLIQIAFFISKSTFPFCLLDNHALLPLIQFDYSLQKVRSWQQAHQ